MYKNILLIALLISVSLLKSQTASRLANSPFPVSQAPDKLYIVNMEHYTEDQRLTTISLQGMLAKTQPQIYCWRSVGFTLWINDLYNNYGVEVDSTYFLDFDGLITHFKDSIGSYYLCNLNDSSTNVAITACASHTDKIAVTSNTQALMSTLNIPLEYDVRPHGEYWMFENFGNTFSTKIISYQQHSKSTLLGDYTIFANAFQFFDDVDGQLTTEAFARMDDNSMLFGWGIDEKETVEKASENSINVVPADWSENITVMSNFEANLQQNTHATGVIDDDDIHTVCFLMSDGDNINWFLHEFADPNYEEWYGSSERGQVDIGWSISPSFSELAPTIMKYVYDSASNTSTAQDYFIASTSGLGYMYPNLYPALNSATNLLDEYMNKADLNIVNIIGTDYNNNDMLPFLQQESIDGIFYYDFDSYAGLQGDIHFVNNKPVVGGRYNFWEGFNTVTQLANKLNNESTNAYSQDGYSLIPVHVWSRTVADVNAVAALLDDNVVVVTPDEFIKRIQLKMGNVTYSNTINTLSDISISPNPSTGIFNISFSNTSGNVNIKIYNSIGETIINKNSASNNIIDISDENNGLYFVKVTTNKGTSVNKIIKK